MTLSHSFAKSAQLDVDSATQMLKDMNDSLTTMFNFYADDAKKIEDPKAIEEFFKMIVSFAQQFEVLVYPRLSAHLYCRMRKKILRKRKKQLSKLKQRPKLPPPKPLPVAALLDLAGSWRLAKRPLLVLRLMERVFWTTSSILSRQEISS